MRVITEKQYKEEMLEYNKLAARAGVINPYNYARRDGVSQHQRSVRGIQRVEKKHKSKLGNKVIAFISHYVGFLKKR